MSYFTKAHTYALEILAGCPDGATTHALTRLRNIPSRVLYDLIHEDLASVKEQSVGTTRLRYTVYRVRLTDAGRKHLATIGAGESS